MEQTAALKRALVIANLLLSVGMPAGAQEGRGLALDSVALGARLRVHTSAHERLQGFLRVRNPHVLHLEADFSIGLGHTPDTTWTVARDRIVAAWTNTGTRWKKGAIWGLIIGAAAGAVAGTYVGLLPDDQLPLYGALVGAGTVAVAGGAIGGAIGAFVRVWKPLQL